MSVSDLMHCGWCRCCALPCSVMCFAVRCANHKESMHFYIFANSVAQLTFNNLMDCWSTVYNPLYVVFKLKNTTELQLY